MESSLAYIRQFNLSFSVTKLVGNELHRGRITHSSSEGRSGFKARSVLFIKNISIRRG